MRGSVTLHIDAPPEAVWALVSDVTNTGRFSPETFEAEWIEGATGPAVGARFRGHVRRTGMTWAAYWTKCTVIACEPGREFAFAVGNPERAINTWRYRFEPVDGGTDATESFELADNAGTRMYWKLRGNKRGKVNADGMRQTLERVKAVAEAESAGTAEGGT
jgi:uncharacterized protein YndB with AHSA1/START domain